MIITEKCEFVEVMASDDEIRYRPTSEFQQNAKDPLIELNLTDSSELWLIQCPLNQSTKVFDGQELTLKLHHNGHLGCLENKSGKSFDVVSFASQDPDATVLTSSASESKIVGKISRRVSLIHYPEPSELQKVDRKYEQPSSTMTSSGATPTKSSRPRHSQSKSGLATSSRSRSSGRRTSLFGSEGPPKAPKRRIVDEPTSTLDQASDKGHNVHASPSSLGNSQEKKSKIRKHES